MLTQSERERLVERIDGILRHYAVRGPAHDPDSYARQIAQVVCMPAEDAQAEIAEALAGRGYRPEVCAAVSREIVAEYEIAVRQ